MLILANVAAILTPITPEFTDILPALGLVPPQLPAVLLALGPVLPQFLPVLRQLFPVLPQFLQILPDRLSISFPKVLPEARLIFGDFPPVAPDLLTVIPDLALVIPQFPAVLPDFPRVPADLPAVAPDFLTSHRGARPSNQEERGTRSGKGGEPLQPWLPGGIEASMHIFTSLREILAP